MTRTLGWNWILAAAALAACGPTSATGDDAGSDTMEAAVVDRADHTADDAAADATPEAARDDVASDAPGAFGVCGASVNECVCACGTEGCRAGCLLAEPVCAACLEAAGAGCCPTQTTAREACARRATEPDDAGAAGCAASDTRCIARYCAAEDQALRACLSDATANDAACRGHYARCTGAFPVRCR